MSQPRVICAISLTVSTISSSKIVDFVVNL